MSERDETPIPGETSGEGGALPLDPHDRPSMLREVLDGLARTQKQLSPKYFYDETGSALFERITRLDAYYPTRRERALLEQYAGGWVRELRPRALVELGAGSARKSRIVLDAMHDAGTQDLYVPVDVSGAYLDEAARGLRDEYPGLRVEPQVADVSKPFALPDALPEPAWVALLGSTIGNFDPEQARQLLLCVATQLRGADRLVLGVDLRPGSAKTRSRLELAYNDPEGLTAEFNRNMLRVLNREIGADFDAEAFEHRAFYSDAHHRIEMHLVARTAQTVRFPGGHEVRIDDGESIRTEISCKHDRGSVEAMFEGAGLEVERWAEDADAFFALVLGRRA